MSTQSRQKRAEQYLAQNKPHLAGELLEKILRDNPNDTAALLTCAKVSLQTGMRHEARHFCAKALEHEPQEPLAWTLLGLAFEEENHDKAVEYLHMAAELEPSGFLANFHLARILHPHDPSQAFSHIQQALKSAPDDLEARLLHARLLRSLDQPKEAIEAFGELLTLQPRFLPPYLELADLLVQRGETSLALEALTEARRCCGANLTLDAQECALQAFVGNWSRAATLSDTLTQRAPQSPQAWLNAGVFYLLQENPEDAEDAFLHAQSLDPTRYEPHFFLAELYQSANLPEKAAQAYQQAIDCNPQAWEPYNNLALLLMAHDPHATTRAQHLLQQAIQTHPTEPNLILNLALACFKQQQLQEAQQLCQQLQSIPLPPQLQTPLTKLQRELQHALS